MTGYESKRAAAQDKLEQWDNEALKLALEALESKYIVNCGAWRVQQDQAITAIKEALAQPAPVQEFGLTLERFNALEAEITTLQADWLFALKEVVRLKAAQPAQEPVAWMMPDGQIIDKWALQFYGGQAGKPLYTTPPQRTWVGLTEPAQQEPVAWGVFEGNLHDMFFTEAEAVEMAQLKGTHAEVKPLYTAPQRPWVGLTDEEIEQGCKESWVTEQAFQSAVWWAEARLKEKNNG